MFDKDGSGAITSAEFKHFMTTMGEKFSEEEVDEIIAEVDKGRAKRFFSFGSVSSWKRSITFII